MDERPQGATGPQPPDPEDPPERTSGLTLETCYRHPRVVTGVHCTRCGRPICTDCMVSAPVGYQCPECVREVSGAWPRRRARLVLGRPGSITTSLLAINIAMFVVEMVYGRLSPTNGDLFNL